MNRPSKHPAKSNTNVLVLFAVTAFALGIAILFGTVAGILHLFPSIVGPEGDQAPRDLFVVALLSLLAGGVSGFSLKRVLARRKITLEEALRSAPTKTDPINWLQEWTHFRAWLRRGLRGEGWAIAKNPANLPEEQRDRFRQELARTLRDARERALMTQEHLAAAAGLSVRTVRRLEANGQASFESIRAVCSVLGAGVPQQPEEPTKVAWPSIAGALGFVALIHTVPPLAIGLLIQGWHGFVAGLAFLAMIAGLIVWHTQTGDLSGLDPLARSMAQNNTEIHAQIFWALWLGAFALYLAGALFRAGTSPRFAGHKMAAWAGATILIFLSALPLLQVSTEMSVQAAQKIASLEASQRETDLLKQIAQANPFFDQSKAYALHVLPHMVTDGMNLDLPDAYRSEEAYERHVAQMTATSMITKEKLDLSQDGAIALLKQRFRNKHGALLDYVEAQEVSDGQRSFTFRLVGDVLYLLFTDGQGTVLNEPRMQIHAQESPDAALQRATAFVRHVANGSGHAR